MKNSDISQLFCRNGPVQLESLKHRTVAPFSPKKSEKKTKIILINDNIIASKQISSNDFKSSATNRSTLSKTQFSLMLEKPAPKFVEPSLLGTSLYELSLELRSLSDVFNQLRNFKYNAPLKYYSFSSLIELVNASAKCPPDTTLILLSIAKNMILLLNYAKPIILNELIRLTKFFIAERYYYDSYAAYDPKKPERKLQKILKVFLSELENPQINVKEGIFDTRQIEEIMGRFQNSENLSHEQVVEEYVIKYRQERDQMENEEIKNERLKNKRAKNKRLENERLENERLENVRLENERLENERLENERLENERLENERLENERLENERLENERIEKKKQDQEKLKKEKLEKKILERGRIEEEIIIKNKIKKEQMEKERLERDRIERQRYKQERIQKRKEIEERLEKVKLEKERILKKKIEQEMVEKEKINDKNLFSSKIEDINNNNQEMKKSAKEKLPKQNKKEMETSKNQTFNSPIKTRISPKPKLIGDDIKDIYNKQLANQSDCYISSNNDEPILSLFLHKTNPNIALSKKPEKTHNNFCDTNLEKTFELKKLYQKEKMMKKSGIQESEDFQGQKNKADKNNYYDVSYNEGNDNIVNENQMNDNKLKKKIPIININKLHISPKKVVVHDKNKSHDQNNKDSDSNSENIATFLESKDTIHQRKEKGAETYWKLTPSQIRRICELAKLFNDWETAYPASQIVWNEMKNDQIFDVNALLSQIETAFGDFLIEALKTFAQMEGVTIQKLVSPR